MKFKNIFGKYVSKNINKYIVKWDKPCRSKVQFTVKKFFESYWNCHIVVEEFPVFGTKMSCDLINLTKKIAIETHGRQHDKFVPFFHKTRSGYLQAVKRDLQKHAWLESNGIQVVEIFENEVKDLTVEWLKEKFDLEL
jgi:hypothetical protein